MNLQEEQNILYKKRHLIRLGLFPLSLPYTKKKYIRGLVKRHTKDLLLIIYAFIAIALLEISILLGTNFFLDNYLNRLSLANVYITVTLIILLLALFIGVSYFLIKKQKKFILDIINHLRRAWLRYYLYRNKGLRKTDISNLYVKISYHFSLLQTGLNNSFFVAIQWIISMIALISISAFFHPKIVLLSVVFILVNVLVFFIGYLFSTYYLAQDQTFYSRLLRYISNNFLSFNILKVFNREKKFLDEVNEIVEIDNYFRLRREIVLNLGSRIIFALITLGTVFVYLLNLYNPLSFSFFSGINTIVAALFFALHIKLLYLSLRAGMFYFPLKLGLFLTIPEQSFKSISQSQETIFKNLTVTTRKFKFPGKTHYQKDINFNFEQGKRYQFILKHGYHNLIPKLLSGELGIKQGNAWSFKFHSKRLGYTSWLKLRKSLVCIQSQNLYGNYSFAELLAEIQNSKNISMLREYSVFGFLFTKPHSLGSKVEEREFTILETYIIQIAYAIISQPSIVIVDALVVDLEYPEIAKALSAMNDILSKSIIIIQTTKEYSHTDYDITYTI